VVTLFTGLVQDLGEIVAVDASGDGVRLTIGSGLELAEGDSIAVNGVCLTATAIGEGRFGADVMNETLRRSSLAEVAAGARVNLELPLRAADRLGGHFVQGHVDGVGGIWDMRDDGFARVVTVGVPADLMRYVVEKGSIAIDGVSLTVSALGDDWLQVSLIPETLERTILGDVGVGQLVNLEVDVLAKYIERLAVAR
jgi:riboflavin synthase